jgi:cell division protease FtsH
LSDKTPSEPKSDDRSEKIDKPEKQPASPESGSPKRVRLGLVYIMIAIFLAILLNYAFEGPTTEANYDEFLWHLERGHVKSLELGDEYHRGVVEIPAGAPVRPRPVVTAPATGTGDGESASRRSKPKVLEDRLTQTGTTTFRVNAIRLHEPNLIPLLEQHGVKFRKQISSEFWPATFYILPFLLILAFWYFLMRQSGSVGRSAMAFGRSKAKLQANLQSVTFDDVAGCDEAKVELSEIVDFLRNPKKYQSLGGRMPKGILLVGPPGTGKTLLARATSGESKVPFFTLSGSDFVEMFVGVGAARVRDLFQQAKAKAPCIVFVDELDAVGRHRGAGLGGGHDEREQTLNQLLVEMDGFDSTKGVIFLAATNRPDVLGPALLRPGRFDRQIVIDAPDMRGREEILIVHAREKPFAPGVEFGRVAASTPGFTGADLANVINEAALLAARAGKEQIEQADINEAIERVIAGPERKSRRLSDEERERVAYHETGHALVAALTKHSDPVRKISIIPRGHAALGYTMQTPDVDRFISTRSALVDRLRSLLAGRAAEIIVYDERSTGAANDLERATRLARSMVCRFGMSERMGPVTFGREEHQVFLGRDFGQEERNYSELSAQHIDEEVRRILDEASDEAVRILTEHRRCLERITQILLEKEVVQGSELDDLLKEELGDDYRTAERTHAGAASAGVEAARSENQRPV